MKLLKKLTGSSAVTLGALVLALALLGYSTIGGARAALTYYSEDYVSTMEMHELGVTLVENNDGVATGSRSQGNGLSTQADEDTLLKTLKVVQGEGEGAQVLDLSSQPIRLNTHYIEELAVRNPTDTASDGQQNITQYVRVTIYRYWTKGGKEMKLEELDPAYIQLWLNGEEVGGWDEHGNAIPFSGNGWIEDLDARTTERMVLYYTVPVEPGAETALFADHFSIDPEVGLIVDEDTADTGVANITNTVGSEYVYHDASFHLEVKVDAVQDHNPEDAILSAWGRTVTMGGENGTTITNIA